MTISERPSWSELMSGFGSPRFSAVLATVAIGTALSVQLVRATMGWAGLVGILSALVALATVSLVARRKDLDWHGVLPLSLLAFLAWSALTVVWSSYQGSSISGVVYQLTFSFLALYVALVRDLIQIVRAVGDVMRVILTVSLGLEVLSGLLIDMPIKFLAIQGNLDEGGPLQGLFGTRNMLGLVALIALVTFLVERTTRSVTRGRSAYSIALAVVLLLGSRSPVSLGVAGFVLVAALVIFTLRRVRPELRRSLQLGLLLVLVIGTISAYFVRTRILAIIGARSEFTYRLEIWNQLSALIDYNQLEGWGWVGLWPSNVSPFFALDIVKNRGHTSGLNAFIDVYFQLGLIGLVIFVGMVGLALVRAWILATSKKSVIYMWPALILVVLIVTSLAESVILVEYGWMFFVVCMVKAAHSLSWRQGLAITPTGNRT